MQKKGNLGECDGSWNISWYRGEKAGASSENENDNWGKARKDRIETLWEEILKELVWLSLGGKGDGNLK